MGVYFLHERGQNGEGTKNNGILQIKEPTPLKKVKIKKKGEENTIKWNILIAQNF